MDQFLGDQHVAFANVVGELANFFDRLRRIRSNSAIENVRPIKPFGEHNIESGGFDLREFFARVGSDEMELVV